MLFLYPFRFFTCICIFLLVFLCNHPIKCSSMMEVIVLKYETASATGRTCPVLADATLYLNFGFCLCSQAVPSPEEYPQHCKCSRNHIGKKGSKRGKNCAQWTASYSQACLSKPDSAKCLMARIYSHPTRFAYIRVGIDEQPLTSPAWQSIAVGRKQTAKLATAQPAKLISITYSVQNVQPKGVDSQDEYLLENPTSPAKGQEQQTPVKIKEIKSAFDWLLNVKTKPNAITTLQTTARPEQP
uniref:Uncharacterized protein n=1 Tax=Ditylenchus dipsaci TaxID=166011 RepID=A0A915CTY0_9BILA